MNAWNRWTWVILLVVLPLCFAAQQRAYGAGIASVAVSHSGKDPVGNSLSSAVSEAIRASAGFTLGQVDGAQFEISMVTIDPDVGTPNEGSWTVASIVFLARNGGGSKDLKARSEYPLFLTGMVLRVGKYKLDEAATRILRGLEAEIAKFKGSPAPSKAEAPAKRIAPAKDLPPPKEETPPEQKEPPGGATPTEEVKPADGVVGGPGDSRSGAKMDIRATTDHVPDSPEGSLSIDEKSGP